MFTAMTTVIIYSLDFKNVNSDSKTIIRFTNLSNVKEIMLTLS